MSPARRRRLSWAAAVGAIWLSVQVGLFFFGPRNDFPTPHPGVRHAYDTHQFLDAVDFILAGKLPPTPGTKGLLYLAYDLFIVLFIGLGLGQLGLVIAQSLLTALAAWCLWRLASRLYDERTGLVAALLYVACIDVHVWNFYVLSDSLFASMLVVTAFLLVEARSRPAKAAAALAVIFTSLVKPHGVVVLASAGAYVLYALWRARRRRDFALASAVVLPAAAAGAYLLSYYPGREPLFQGYAEGAVIVNYRAADLPASEALTAALAGMKNPLALAAAMALNDPGHFLRLFGTRLWYFALHVRPYYSALHNYAVLAALLPSYALAAWGALTPSRRPEGKFLLLALCFFQTGAVLLTKVSRDGRYLAVILPIVLVFTAAGAVRLWDALAASLRGRPARGPSRA